MCSVCWSQTQTETVHLLVQSSVSLLNEMQCIFQIERCQASCFPASSLNARLDCRESGIDFHISPSASISVSTFCSFNWQNLVFCEILSLMHQFCAWAVEVVSFCAPYTNGQSNKLSSFIWDFQAWPRLLGLVLSFPFKISFLKSSVEVSFYLFLLCYNVCLQVLSGHRAPAKALLAFSNCWKWSL